MWKTMLKNLIAGCDPRRMALYSRRNYHVKDLDYVCLFQTPELRGKLYFCPPTLAHNSQGFLVNPHSHANNFHTFVVEGWVRETQFDAVPLNPRSNLPWFEFEHEGAGASHDAKFHVKDRVSLIANASVRFRAVGVDTNYLTSEKIHTIEVAHDSPTILFLLEYRSLREGSSPTRYFSTDSRPPNVDGLYNRMNEDRVVELLGDARQALEV